MKIAIDCHTLEIEHWAGKEQYLSSILRELNKIDKENDYILYFRRKVFDDSKPFGNWKIKNINLPTPFWQLAVIIDLIISGADWLIVPCTYLLPFLNIFVSSIVVVHDLTTFLPATRKTHKLMTRFKEKLLLRGALFNAKKIIAVSENTKKDLINFFKTDSHKIFVIGEAAQSRFKPVARDAAMKEKLAKYKVPGDFILFVGTLEPRKNIVTLINAYKSLIAAGGYDRYKLVLVGQTGWYYQEIFNRVKELNLEDKVIFTGYISDDEVPYLLSVAHCFVYPSIYEGFGLPPLEAMSCGCPVITSKLSSLPEVVGDAAILINPNSKEEIYLAIKKILSDDNFRKDLIKKGLERSKLFSWENAASGYMKLYRS